MQFDCFDQDSNSEILDRNIIKVEKFIKQGEENGESVLIQSTRGQCRVCCMIAALLMRKYKWGLFKTLEYLYSRKNDL